MHHYIIWLCLAAAPNMEFYEIISAPDARTAERLLNKDKRYNKPIVLSVNPYNPNKIH